mgnify:CR=1 FL=1
MGEALPFNSFEFALFLLASFACYQVISSAIAVRTWFLIVVSLLYYGSWGVWFVPLLVFTVVLDFFVAEKIAKTQAREQKAWLVGSLGFNIALIVGFKSAFKLAWVSALPLGLSFYTFQSMSYMLDVYRGVCVPANFRQYFASITFFPQLLAGPIVRANFLIPQLQKTYALSWPTIRLSLWLLACGACKKSLADWMGGFVDRAYEDEVGVWSNAILASFGFVVQMYGDFSGYSDMARGSALLFGIELPVNFFKPFSATSPQEYYSKRWHVSLASWIHDYLYVPVTLFLGRRGVRAPVVAVLFTMGLMGLWHGLGVNFVAWGLYVGGVLCLAQLAWRLKGVVGTVVTFYLVTVGLVLFRAPDLAKAAEILLALHGQVSGIGAVPAVGFTLCMIFLMHGLSHVSDVWQPRRLWVWYVGTVLMGTVAFSIGRSGTSFIYFHF